MSNTYNALIHAKQDGTGEEVANNLSGGGDVSDYAKQEELSNLVLTGTTNTSGATIAAGTCFVLNGDFVTAKADIASGATFTLNTNYEKKSVGSILTELNSNVSKLDTYTHAHFNYLNQYKLPSGDTYNRVGKCGHICMVHLDQLSGVSIPVNNTEYIISEALPQECWPKDWAIVKGYIDGIHTNVLTVAEISPNDGCVRVIRVQGTPNSDNSNMLISVPLIYIC